MQESLLDGSLVKTAIIGYYSDETAREALQGLNENMALGLDRPLRLEYYGPMEMNEVGMYPNLSTIRPLIRIPEAEILKRLSLAMMLNGIPHDH